MRSRFVKSAGALSAFLFLSWGAANADAPATGWRAVEGDYVIRDFHFASGETLPELRLHYAFLGKPRRDSRGRVDNAVLILHGTGGSGRSLLNDHFAGVLFGRGQLLDSNKYFIILPDAIGHGKSSRPSDGLHARFPQYAYKDMVAAQHALVLLGLQVDHLRLVMGTSMGCMHTFMWGETFADFMDALMPLACLPVQIAGRNRLWRDLLMDAIRADPQWAQGEYQGEPVGALRTAFAAGGGHLDRMCTPNPALRPGVAQPVPIYECAIEGKLKGAWVDLALGSGWWLPGKPQPRTAVLVVVETKTAATGTTPAVTHATLPSTPPDITGFIPAGWTVSPTVCDVACPANTTGAVISTTGTLTATAADIARAAMAKGFRIEGKPCKQEPALRGCEIQADRRENGTLGGLTTVLDVTLAASAGGHVGGTLSLTDQS